MSSDDALSQLCQRCGLCCSGSLFTFLPMSEQEAETLRGLGARVHQRKDGRWALELGCAVLQGTRCGAYEQRPLRCREYVCQLGRAVEREERSLEAALAIVDEAKRQLAELNAMLPPATNAQGPVHRGLAYEATEPDDPHFRAVRTATKKTEAFLRQYFIGT